MKKLLFLLVLLLSACQRDILDEDKLKKYIVTEMEENVTSFEVHEVFNLKQYGSKNDLTHNRAITIDNTIDYDQGVIKTVNSMNETLTIDSSETRQNYDFETYVDLYNNTGYIKGEKSSWYEVELSQIVKVGMGSIDPLSIVNSILYENDSITFRPENRVSGPLDEAVRAVAVIDKEVFENMFISSVFSFLDIKYDYKVTVTLKYDESYRVEYIEFDLSELEEKYDDYKYELKIDITALTSSLKLDFSKYNEKTIKFNPEAINWIIDGEASQLSIDDIKNNLYIGEVISDITYNSNKNKYEANFSLELTEDVDYLSFELFFLSKGELLPDTYESEFSNVKTSQNVLLYYFEPEQLIEHIYFKMRYIPANTTEIIEVSQKVVFDVEKPAHEIDPDLSKFIDEPIDLVPNILVEHTTFDKGEKVYKLNIDLYSKEDIRNGEIILYLYDDSKLKRVIPEDDLVIDQYGNISFDKNIDFMPSEIYAEIKYKTSFFWYNEQYIKVDFKKVEGSFDSKDYESNEDVLINITEIEDSKWRAYKYFFNFDFSESTDEFGAYIFFVGENNYLIGWEYIYNLESLDTYEHVSKLYETKVKYVYIDLDLKGNILENYQIKGEFIGPIN